MKPIRIIIVILFITGFGILASVHNGSGVPSSNSTITQVSGTVDLSPYEGYGRAVFAGGCFWGVEALFEQQEGVIAAFSGYTGGKSENPTYKEVSSGKSGHVEAVIVYYDKALTDYRRLAKFFFEIHDPEQRDGQGPDIGPQYRSVIYYESEEERGIAEELIDILEAEGYDIATRIEERSAFWPAEEYHQDYYERKRSSPYCHFYTPRFPQE